MREFMEADIAAAVAVCFEFEEVFLTAGCEASAHAPGALVASEAVVFIEGLAFIVTPFRQIGGNLVAADYVQFGACRDEIRDDQGLVAEEHREATVCRIEGLV